MSAGTVAREKAGGPCEQTVRHYFLSTTRFPSLNGPPGRGDVSVFFTYVAAHRGGQEKYFFYVRDGSSQSGSSEIWLVGDIFN